MAVDGAAATLEALAAGGQVDTLAAGAREATAAAATRTVAADRAVADLAAEALHKAGAEPGKISAHYRFDHRLAMGFLAGP